MKAFSRGQRVKVLANADSIRVDAVGTVSRLRRQDDGAWIHLDERHQDERVHPFGKDDETRSTSELAYPEDCDPVVGGGP